MHPALPNRIQTNDNSFNPLYSSVFATLFPVTNIIFGYRILRFWPYLFHNDIPRNTVLQHNANATAGSWFHCSAASWKTRNSSNGRNGEEQSDCNSLLSKGLLEMQVKNHKSGQLLLCFKPCLSQIPQIPSSALRHFAYQSVLHSFKYVLTSLHDRLWNLNQIHS